jgi:hypothetical protein
LSMNCSIAMEFLISWRASARANPYNLELYVA